MPNYFYIAKSLDGQTSTGTLSSIDERQLAQDLKRRGLLLVKAALSEESKKSKFDIPLPFSGVSLSEKIMMTRNLEVMFSTGLSLVKSFDVLASQSKNQKLKKALFDIKDKINQGSSFSEALGNYPKIFSELFCNMVKIGEESGTLDEIFQILSLQFQKEHELKSKVQSAMIYPSIIIVVMFIIGIVMATFVLPSLKVFFSTLSVDMPIYTKAILFLSDFLTIHWYLLIIIPLGLAVLLFLIIKTKRGKEMIDTILLKLPLISQIVKKSTSAFLVRSLSSLIAAGVPLTRSLEISSKTIGNRYFKEAMIQASERIKKGEKLSAALKSYQNLFPVGVIEMMEVGEETGKTSDVLKRLADFYEQEAISSVEKLTAFIEPVLIIFLGLGVGVFALSIIQPIYSSLQSVSQ